MLKLIAFVLSTILSLSTVTAFASDLSPVKPLEVGIIPYLSPRALVTNYEPMRLYLENSLGRPVKIYTAISFRQFLINAQHGDYDLVFAAAHIARMLEHDQKYKPVARFATKNHTLIMVAKDSLIKNVNDLKGKVLAVPDFMSLSSIIAISYLREAGLMAGRDFKIQEVPSFNAAISNVQLNEAAAAITATNIIAQMPKELRDSVKSVIDAGVSFRMIILTHPRLGIKNSLLVKQALLKMPGDPIQGKQTLSNTRAGGIVAVTEDEMKSLDRYIPETRRLLALSP